MKKIFAIVAMLVLIIAMSSCSVTVDSKPSDSKSSTTASSSPSEDSSPKTQSTPKVSDDKFVGVVKDNTNAFDTVDTATLVTLAHSVCTAWDNGLNLVGHLQLFIKHDFPAKDSGFFIGAATAAYCPQYVDDLKKEAKQYTSPSAGV